MKMHRISLLVVNTLFFIFQAYPQSNQFEAHTFNNGADFNLPYRFYIPKNMQTGKKYPLILFLHGAGDWGTNNRSQLANFPYHFIDSTNSAAYPCYFLAPQCTQSAPWSNFPDYPDVRTLPYPTKSTAQVLSLIDTLLHSDTVKIDKNRIYVTGFSLGGEGAFDIITRAPDLFAAAIPICGIADTAKAQLMKNTPLWIFHGSEDTVNRVTYSRIIVDALTKIGKPPKYTEYEGRDHAIWSTAYKEPDLLPWLFSYDKSDQVRLISNKARLNQYLKLNPSAKYDKEIVIVSKPFSHPFVTGMLLLNGRRLPMKYINANGTAAKCLVTANNRP
jgi:predicted peptidase